MISHDQEFLYIAARCRKTAVDKYPTPTAIRGRTANLDLWDRVRICIDFDRDYSSFVELAVDCRGQVSDELHGGGQWDPDWYVADWRTDQEWGFEAAIPWEQMIPPDQLGAVLLNVVRIAPKTGLQSWTPDGSIHVRPNGFGIVTFDNVGTR